ncbi:hypothetical protein [Rufibacter psychrotolerans]|uniref:hypothetical protein n=1 Tax=Rufibacter psychrotolerans TaxID=2812556 RepID=UPI00196731CE|nr:hypothetical protein [Rufibacter sp. SYSU D00308]
MDSNETTQRLSNLLKDPSQIMALISNPGKTGMDLYRSLSNKDKQYVAYAAGVGLLIYGYILSRQNKAA